MGLFISTKLKAQNGIAELIKSGPADAAKLTQAYTEPFLKGIGTALNSGWANTAKTKDPLGFELKVTGTVVFTPSAYQTFNITQIGLSNNIKPADAAHIIAPTLTGSNISGPVMNIYDNNGNKTDQFTLPSRKLPFTPLPQLQASIGMIGHTELIGRIIPKKDYGNDIGTVWMIGGELKHDIVQDFTGDRLERQIPFHLAIAFGYSYLNYSLPLSVVPENGGTPKDSHQNTSFGNQHLSGKFNSYNAQLILSKKLSFFVPFVAAGYSKATSQLELIGNYPVTTGMSTLVQPHPTFTTYTDPFTISATSINGAHTEAGFQLEMGLFRFYASGSAFKYDSNSDMYVHKGNTWGHSVNAGIGIEW